MRVNGSLYKASSDWHVSISLHSVPTMNTDYYVNRDQTAGLIISLKRRQLVADVYQL